MSTIGGKKRENTQLPEFTKKVGLFEANVIAVNPTIEEFKDILGIELKEDSNMTNYITEKTDTSEKKVRIDFWLEEVKTKEKFKINFYLENKIRLDKDGIKTQYINSVGTTSWAADENDLKDWFTARDYRKAYVGEEDLYSFMKVWLGNLDYKDAETTLQLDFKKLLNGNVRDIKLQVGGEWSTSFIALATVEMKEKDGETKTYQRVYNRMVLPAYVMKQFKNIDYSKNKDLVASIAKKDARILKAAHEKFINKVAGQYGCKDFYVLGELRDYNPDDNLVASDAVISEEGSDY